MPLLLLPLLLAACGPDEVETLALDEDATAEFNTLTSAEREAGWQMLFDGESLEGWHGYRRADVPEAWTVTEDGTLHTTGEGGDLITEEQYEDFELVFDWKVAPEGNSGVMYGVQESEAYDAPYHTGPEYQLIDDENYPAELEDVQKSGANYGLHAPSQQVTRPAGEWNRSRIVVRGPQVEHWLNGEQVVAFERWGADWKRRVAETKFAQWPDYGMAEEGHIALQGHGDEVWFRNIKIRPL